MGAWGHGVFDNDSALDWFAEVQEVGVDAVRDALSFVTDLEEGEYLEVDEASAALAAAEFVAEALGRGDDRLSGEPMAWLEAHRAEVGSIGAALARQAVERLFANSELRDLWNENGANTPWHIDVRDLIARLGV